MKQGLLEVYADIFNRLESIHARYMVVGSVASLVYGEARFTRDIDLVVEISNHKGVDWESAFPEELYYCPPNDLISSEWLERGQFNLIHHDSGLKIDIIFNKDSEYGRTRFQRRKKIQFTSDLEFWVASPEDVVIKKLDFFREGNSDKHLRDIRAILVKTKLDQAYLDHWIDEFSLKKQWEKVTK